MKNQSRGDRRPECTNARILKNSKFSSLSYGRPEEGLSVFKLRIRRHNHKSIRVNVVLVMLGDVSFDR